MKGLALVGPTDSPAPKLTSLVEIKQTNREMFWKIEPYSHSVYTNEAANGFIIVDSSLSFQSRETSREKKHFTFKCACVYDPAELLQQQLHV